jgi:hypothetical protein
MAALLAVLFIVVGFGSLALDHFNRHFSWLSWSEHYQPWAGIGLGVLGVIVLMTRGLAGRGGEA